ncbi:pyridoxal phosphate-dependent transferase [Umbelopsis sp. PMI_123]|nr:pyridoxal phosphate-dependent transferase [Umbelopsis sp. PMI_123]
MTTLFDDKPTQVIDLSIGAPSRDLMPIDMMATACQSGLSCNEDAWNSFQYGPEAGDLAFREELAVLLSTQTFGLHQTSMVQSHTIACTSGASQSFVNLLSLLTDPIHTSHVFLQSPTYHLVFQMVKDRGFDQNQLVAVPEDDDGIQVDWLEQKLNELQIGDSPAHPRYYNAVLYTVPTYSNPSGSILTHERRQKLVELACRHHLLVICDDVYDMLYQDSTSRPPPSLISYDLNDVNNHPGRGNIISNGTFSKILAPGMRCGWVQARPEIINLLTNSGLYSSGGSPAHFVSKMILETLKNGSLLKHIGHSRLVLRDRLVNGLLKPIDNFLVPLGCSYREPQGGYFVWLKLPKSINSNKLQNTIERHKINVSCGYGYRFAVPSNDAIENKLDIGRHVRLCFAYYSTSDLNTAIGYLHQAIKLCIEADNA